MSLDLVEEKFVEYIVVGSQLTPRNTTVTKDIEAMLWNGIGLNPYLIELSEALY